MSFVAAAIERQQRDAERYAQLDDDVCMVCGAVGLDRRTLLMRYFYELSEVAPEFLDLTLVDRVKSPGLPAPELGLYYLRTCKSCRGEILGAIQAAITARRALRGLPLGPDGDVDLPVELEDPERNIPVRVLGRTIMLTRPEWDEFRRQQGPPAR